MVNGRYTMLRSRLLGSADREQFLNRQQEVRLGKEEQCRTKIIIIKRHKHHSKCGNTNQLLNSVTTTLRKAHSRFDYNIVSRDTLKIIFDDCLGARSGHNNIIKYK